MSFFAVCLCSVFFGSKASCELLQSYSCIVRSIRYQEPAQDNKKLQKVYHSLPILPKIACRRRLGAAPAAARDSAVYARKSQEAGGCLLRFDWDARPGTIHSIWLKTRRESFRLNISAAALLWYLAAVLLCPLDSSSRPKTVVTNKHTLFGREQNRCPSFCSSRGWLESLLLRSNRMGCGGAGSFTPWFWVSKNKNNVFGVQPAHTAIEVAERDSDVFILSRAWQPAPSPKKEHLILSPNRRGVPFFLIALRNKSITYGSYTKNKQ